MEPAWNSEFTSHCRKKAAAEFEKFCEHNSDDLLAVRYFLAYQTLGFTMWELLTIPAPPGVDQTGARDGNLVTGELNAKLDEILHNAKTLKLLGFESPPPVSSGYWLCMGGYQAGYVSAHAFNALRVAVEKPNHPDWYRPSAATFYAYWEHLFREALGMPGAPGEGAIEFFALRYGLIVDLIANGCPNPYEKWCEQFSMR